MPTLGFSVRFFTALLLATALWIGVIRPHWDPFSSGALASGPTDSAACRRITAFPCYTPTQIRHAYGLDALHARGLDGRGRTIAIVIPAVNRNVQVDLDTFSDRFGLPRTQIEVIDRGAAKNPMGAIEATVDLQMVHLAAPGAKLILVETGTSSLGGIGDVMRAVSWLTTNRTVDVIPFSFGAAEPSVLATGGGPIGLATHRRGLIDANAHGTTLLAATGDYGPGGHSLTGDDSARTVPWPASDPLVTAVGGTRLHLDATGTRTTPDEVWTTKDMTRDPERGNGATGGGVSTLFPRPAFQASAASLLGDHRGVPDIVANASDQSPIWLYSGGSALPGRARGWSVFRGTSVAAPLMAGVVAIAAQQAGRPLGEIGPRLYAAAAHPEDAGLLDLTDGCNHTRKQSGFCAGSGYDLVSGVGALQDAGKLVKVLAPAS